MNYTFQGLIKRINPALIIFLVAFLLRLTYLEQARVNSPYFYFPEMDSEIYDNWAQEIARGDWLGREVFWASPLYPYFLGILYSIFGRNLYLVRLIQLALGSFSCVLLYFLGKRIFDQPVGFIAALLAAGYGIFIFYESVLLPAFLGIFLNLLVVLSILWAQGKGRENRWFLVGLLAGLAALARPNVLLFIPVLLIWLAVVSRGCLAGKTIRACLLLALGVILAIAPVTLRNYIVGRDFVPISSQGGLNFYIGNNPEAEGIYQPIAGISDAPGRQIEDAHLAAERTLGRSLQPSEVSHFWFGQGLRFIKTEPGRWFRLTLRKFSLFWKRKEVTMQAHYYFCRRFSTLLSLPLFSYAIVSPLAICGIVLTLKNWRKAGLLYLFIFSYAATLVLFFIEARYRLPVVPFLMIFSGFTIRWCFAKIKGRNYRSLAFCLISLSLVSYFTNYPRISSRSFAPAHYQLGTSYEKRGEYGKALSEYQKALAATPDHSEARMHLGLVYSILGKPEEALRQCELLASGQPDSFHAHYLMGNIYAVQERYEEAVSEYQTALEMKPDHVETYINLGNTYAAQEKYQDAINAYEDALEIDPDDADCHYNLAIAYQEIGRSEEAKKHKEQAFRLNPELVLNDKMEMQVK